jgi:nickel/cobalt transporter (NicO) family protein
MTQSLLYLLSSFWLGAVHAATPGHGKTIAAAYIVGARGRPVDAVILGIFVTLSHTSGIVLVAILASLGSAWLIPQRVEAYLALFTGILVIGIGLWMLWTQRIEQRRTAGGSKAAPGRAHEWDEATHEANTVSQLAASQPMFAHAPPPYHVHPHGLAHLSGHHHRHQNHDHHYHAHGHEHGELHDHHHNHVNEGSSNSLQAQDRGGDAYAARADEAPGYHSHGWGVRHTHRIDLITRNRPSLMILLGLGIAGGLLPDPGALAILLAALAQGKVVLGLLTVLVFSIGFASTLVVVGVIAAQVGQKVLTWLSGPWATRIQAGTAFLIVAVGVILTANAARMLANLA